MRLRSQFSTHLLPLMLAVMAAFALTSCEAVDSLTGASGAASTTSGDSNAPLVSSPAAPRDVAAAFLTAWGQRNYDVMYDLLSSEARGLTPAPVFRAVYQQADQTIGTSGVRYTFHDTTEQGRTTALSYDIVIESGIFGEIADDGRTMRLVSGASGYRIAWTNMDIFDGFASGATLIADTRRQPRGNIYDRNGIPMVEQDSPVTDLYIARGEISDEQACLTLLAQVLRRQRSDVVAYFARFTNPETIFGFGEMDTSEFERYSTALAERCAIRTENHVTRRYAGHGAASHITGYIGQQTASEQAQYSQLGYSPGDLVGKSGIEQQYEAELAGSAARVLRITTPEGLIIRELAGAEGQPPQNVTLTIDWDLQLATSQALADAYTYAEPSWGSREHSTGGGIVVMDVQSGEVLALSSFPSFDPGIFNPDTSYWSVGEYIATLAGDPRQPFINRIIQQQYPPGSTFKIITAAAAAEENIWQPDQIFYCGRTWEGRQYGDTFDVRYDWRNFEPEDDNFDTGEVDMSEALTASCNPFFYQMGAELFRRRPTALTDYARQMGLGRPTGIDLPEPEAAGQIVPPTGIDASISVAIGQLDTQVTMIQMARMVAGVADGGTLHRPYVVQSVGRAGETPTYQLEDSPALDMGLSADTLGVITEGMCGVTDASVYGRTSDARLGTAWFDFSDPTWYPAPYQVCGKTGTAQTTRPEPMGWFVAFAPADNPQIAIAGMIEYGREGSETSGPIIRRILDSYFDVPLDQVMPYPEWWTQPYNVLPVPNGSTGA